MKKLTLLRHAKSSWEDPAKRDFDRPLNKRGRKAARTVGRWMGETGLAFDHVVISPAARVLETIEKVEESLGRSLEARRDERIYRADTGKLIGLLRELDGEFQHVLISGHNPGLEDLALALSSGDRKSPLRASVWQKYPTAAVIELELDIDDWDAVGESCGRITRFVRPRDLDSELGPEKS